MTIRTTEFLSAFRREGEAVFLRTFKPKKAPDSPQNAPRKWSVTLAQLATDREVQEQLIAQNRHCGLYFVVNPGGDTDAAIRRFAAWFAENDSISIPEQHSRLDAAPLAPSIRVETRNSVHAYWLNSGDCTAAEWREIQERLIAFFGSDPKIKNPSRVMRVPGFDHLHVNGNGPERKKVTVHTFDRDRRYSIAQMREAFPLPAATERTPQAIGRFEFHEDRHTELCQRLMARGKRNSKGNWDARAACHNGLGDKGLVYFPESGAVVCNNDPKCDYFTILRAEGLPDGHLPSKDSIRTRTAQTVQSRTAEVSSNGASGSELEAWDDPPVAFYEQHKPAFPVSALPGPVQMFVEGLSRETQTPVDLAAMLSLTVAAGAVAGKVRVRARANWSEPTNIFCVCVLSPGNRKSAVFQEVAEPLEEIERALVVESRDEIAKAASEYRMLEERKARLEKEASKTENVEERKAKSAEAVAVARQLAAMKVPAAPRLLASDATSEVLSTLLAEQGGRMTLLSSEGGPFETMAGRYSNGIPNIDVFLKGHSGDTLRVDRRGRSEIVQQPALTIGLTVQPDVIAGLADNKVFRSRGLLARFLYCLPHSTVGSRQVDPPALSDAHRQRFKLIIRSLAEIEQAKDRNDEPVARLLYLTAEANDLLKEFERELEPKLSEDGELGPLADWAGKLAGAIVRLAGVLWLMEKAEHLLPWPDKISADTMQSAIALGKYLTQHARAAFAAMGADAQVENAKLILRWLIKTELRSFTRRDAHQAHRARFKTVEEIDPPLDLLVAHNYINAKNEVDNDRRPGRKASQTYTVNPHIFARRPQTAVDLDSDFEEGVL